MDYLGKGEMLTNTDLKKFANKIWEKYIYCLGRKSLFFLTHEKLMKAKTKVLRLYCCSVYFRCAHVISLIVQVISESDVHFFIKAWNLVHLYSLGPWTFSEMEPSQKHLVTAILLSTITRIYIFCIISPEPKMIIQNRWCLPPCFDGQGLQWYHIQYHKLFRWIVNGEFSDVVRRKSQYLRTSARLCNIQGLKQNWLNFYFRPSHIPHLQFVTKFTAEALT